MGKKMKKNKNKEKIFKLRKKKYTIGRGIVMFTITTIWSMIPGLNILLWYAWKKSSPGWEFWEGLFYDYVYVDAVERNGCIIEKSEADKVKDVIIDIS